ncbi:MAG: MFS transporter [Anaerolineales bacterium]|nr:MFS transporter [Anaerolineales bacterium]
MTAAAAPRLNDKREIFGWTMYDWANSAFSTTVITVFLGPYLTSIAEAAADANGFLRVLGFTIRFDSFFTYCISISVFLQLFLLPVLGAIADYSHLRKRMLQIFALLGAAATLLMFFIVPGRHLFGGLLLVIGNLSFGASIVFYNAYLPDIAGMDQQDRVSSAGFAMGYAGGGLLLLLNLILFLFKGSLGLDTALVARLSLASAGVWWLGFALITFAALRPRHAVRQLPPGESYFTIGFKQLANTFREIRHFPQTVRYLLAYLFFNDGIQTVIVVSAIFAAQELGMDATTRILVILMIQIVAFGGAYFYGWLAGKLGAFRALITSLIVWSVAVIYAFAGMRSPALVLGLEQRQLEFWLLAFVVAIVLGGSQALSRSLFSRMIPVGREAEFFSFYEVSERGTSWIGPFLFGLVNDRTSSLRFGILSVIVLFIAGLGILLTVNVPRAMAEAGRGATAPAAPAAAAGAGAD